MTAYQKSMFHKLCGHKHTVNISIYILAPTVTS